VFRLEPSTLATLFTSKTQANGRYRLVVVQWSICSVVWLVKGVNDRALHAFSNKTWCSVLAHVLFLVRKYHVARKDVINMGILISKKNMGIGFCSRKKHGNRMAIVASHAQPLRALGITAQGKHGLFRLFGAQSEPATVRPVQRAIALPHIFKGNLNTRSFPPARDPLEIRRSVN
jgi:hypothetical protein